MIQFFNFYLLLICFERCGLKTGRNHHWTSRNKEVYRSQQANALVTAPKQKARGWLGGCAGGLRSDWPEALSVDVPLRMVLVSASHLTSRRAAREGGRDRPTAPPPLPPPPWFNLRSDQEAHCGILWTINATRVERMKVRSPGRLWEVFESHSVQVLGATRGQRGEKKKKKSPRADLLSPSCLTFVRGRLFVVGRAAQLWSVCSGGAVSELASCD